MHRSQKQIISAMRQVRPTSNFFYGPSESTSQTLKGALEQQWKGTTFMLIGK